MFKLIAIISEYKTYTSPKCYMIKDDTDEQTKGAQKGIRKDSKLEYQSYLDTLYSTTAHMVPQVRMQYNKQMGSMTIQEQNKAGLNPIYTKLYTNEDLITISPLKKNGEYV